MNRKIRVLGIAPYQNLKTTMLSVAASYEELELEIFVGNLDDGVQLARQHMNENFDVILSRGGTAELIQKNVSLPVIDIGLTIDDILRATLLLQNMTESYAVVGYPSVTRPARALGEIMNFPMNIFTIHHQDELNSILDQLKEQGCSLVLCDVITELSARKAGLDPILITSGPESLKIAFESAITLCNCIYDSQAYNSLFAEALQMQDSRTLILSGDGNVLFSTYNEENITSIIEHLQSMLQDPHAISSRTFQLIDNSLYSVSVKTTSYQDAPCYIFSLEQNPIPIGGSKHGIRFSSYTQVSVSYSNSFYSLTSSARLMEEKIRQINQTSLPVMILGERGTGKNHLAEKLYLESSLTRHPYICIDCQMLSDKVWNYVINHYNSPLNDNNNTIFIGNIQDLSKERQGQLLSLLIDTKAHTRNRLLFSCSQTLPRGEADPSRDFIDYLTCTTLCLPPLRELAENIQTSANLYLNTLNIEMAKQIVGIDQDALELLRSYSWPDNFMQLKRVLAELVMLTSTPYIRRETVVQVLEKEKRQYIPAATVSFDYDRSLADMTSEIVNVVLSRCGGNQTLAAKKLGIGRTTLWRYLNS